MSKYEDAYAHRAKKPPLVDGEQIIYSAKPKKNAFILNKVLNMLPLALVWLAFDSVFIIGMLSADVGPGGFFIVPFFLLHLMPVWIWLGNVLTANRRWKNTAYYVTDRRILIQTGVVGRQLQSIYYKDISNVNLHFDLVDRLLGVGDIYFDLGTYNQKGKAQSKAFLDVENPQEAYTKIQKIVMDMQTDMEFPNAYRPENNPGYSTQYHG